ncbi:MAG: ATP-binding cassette domain-containing protein [Anaerolineae bacterium]|nr:ATP-binding cassette domain-containing protein [Anaerolineae bacterium]
MATHSLLTFSSLSTLLYVSQLVKRYGGLTALNAIDLKIAPGEVVGLTGTSGAGTTTLLNVISGRVRADDGEMFFDGRRLLWPFDANSVGIRVIHQRPELSEQLDITSNIFLGHEIGRNLFKRWLHLPDMSKMDEQATILLTRLEAPFSSLREKVVNLSSEERQLVAIAQIMVAPPQLILIDDPSPQLSYPYQEKLLQLIREWQQIGSAILFNSKNLDELFAVSDRLIVLRQGYKVLDERADETNREEIVAALVGTADRQKRTPVIWALDSYYRARRQAETLRHNQGLLQRDLADRDLINRQLVDQLADQVQALDSANLALQDAQRRLLTEREQERKHLARELHDQSIQDLLSLNYQLEDIGEQIKDDNALQSEIADVREHIRTLVAELRRICGNLRPPTIDSLGLGAALQSYTHDWSRRTGITVDLQMEDSFGRLPEATELSIFRIVQEGLNNVWKHAEATAVTVALRNTSPRMLQVSIADNGRGLDEGFDLASLSSAGHYGLLGISERVALMGGRLQFKNQPSGGLRIRVEIPHPRVIESDFGDTRQ